MTARIVAWVAVASALVGGCTSVSGGNVLGAIGAVGGAPVIGTFEVVFDLPSGGTKTITNGSFDLPLSM